MRKQKLLRILLLLTAALSCAGIVNAQAPAMKLSASTVDFGNFSSAMHLAKTVEFTNVSGQKLAILVVEKGPNVKAGYEHRFFQQGEKGLITFLYEARNLGAFNEEVRIYTNLDENPYTVNLTGNVVTIEECFPNKANMNLRNVLVINKENKSPVPLADVTFIHNFKSNAPLLCPTDKNGQAVMELPIGQYNAQSATTGYEPYSLDFFLPRSQPNVVIELVPKKTEIVTPPVENPPPVEIIAHETSTEKIIVTSTELPEDKYAANNIVLLLDVSSSMRQQGKFTLLQQSVNNLVLALRPIDYVSIVTYAGEATIMLKGIPGNDKEKIMGAVQELTPLGITQGVKGLNSAYELALKQYIPNGNNQVILATDGEFSEKNVSDEYYQQFIGNYANKGIRLSIIGFGINTEAIERMKKMSTSGKGSYTHVSAEKTIKDALIEEIKTRSLISQ